MTTRRPIGARLATWTAAVTAGALLAFGLTALVAVFTHEERESARAGTETIEQIGPILALTAPLVLALGYLTTRRLARRLTDRLDRVVDAARRMTHEDLSARLPTAAAADAQDELDELTAALNALFARLDEGLAAQRRFVADASHELRTPLAVLRSDLEIARRRKRTPEEWEAVAERAHDEVVRMTSMIEALLRLARAAEPTARERLAARALLDDVAGRWSAAAADTGVRLAIEAAEDVAVLGDADALAVALGNLIGNAIAHSPAGGVVTISARADADTAVLAVLDQGRGVAAADRERIFQPFARGAGAADRKGTGAGVGLGLSVARRIVESHGGTLTVDDAAGGGARFVARLPALTAAPRAGRMVRS